MSNLLWEYCQLSVIGSFVLLAFPICQNRFGLGLRDCEGLSYKAHKMAEYYAAISEFQGASQQFKIFVVI